MQSVKKSFANDLSNKGSISRTCREHLEHQQIIILRNGHDLSSCFSKGDVQVANKHVRNAQQHWSSGKCNSVLQSQLSRVHEDGNYMYIRKATGVGKDA